MGSELVFYAVVAALGLCLAVAGVTSALRSRDRRVKRQIRQAAPTAIAAASRGALVRVGGTIEALDGPLRAPITDRACVYYLAVLQVQRPGGRSGFWEEVAREERGVDFLLRDATGSVRVDMRAAEVAVVQDHHTASGTFDDPTASEATFLERHRLAGTTAAGYNLAYRYHEGVLELGEQVGALGLLRDADGVRSLGPGPGTAVLVSDDPATLAPRG